MTIFVRVCLWTFCSVPLICILTPLLIPCDQVLKSGSGIPLSFFFLFKIVLAFVVPLIFHVTFRISLSISKKKQSYWDFDGSCIKSIGQFGENWHFYYVESQFMHIVCFFICLVSSWCFVVFSIQLLHMFCQIYIPKYFILEELS